MTTISLTVLDDDPETVDRLSRQLHTELRATDATSVELVADGEVPAGAKGTAATITAVIVAAAGSPVLVQVVSLIQDWLKRGENRRVKLTVGDRTLEIDGQPRPGDRELLERFLDEQAD